MTERSGPPTDPRDVFQARLKELLFSEADKSQIMNAYSIAEKAHEGQYRLLDHEPYFTHPLAAAYILLDECHITNASIICGALLHDVAEDTDHYVPEELRTKDRKIPKTLKYRDYIANVYKQMTEVERFSEETAEIVISLTKPPIIDEEKDEIRTDRVDFFSKNEAYAKKLHLLRNASPEAILVKMADRLHNLRTFYETEKDPTPERKIIETRKLNKTIFNRAAAVYPQEYALLEAEIDQAEVDLISEYPELRFLIPQTHSRR
jgi:(p)ppGpp synthase/HD superfamily hydrolase